MLRKSAVAILLATAVAVPAAADAAPKTSAEVLGTIVTKDGGEVAEVTARYTCTGEAHLWIAAKQTADGRRSEALTMEGSSKEAKSYLQRHPGDELVCDGRNHVQTFTIDKSEGVGKGALVKGQAWVQFCLYDDGAGATDNRWTHVR